MSLSLWASLFGVPLGNGPILSVLGGTVVMSELNQFEKSSVVLAASDVRAILSMKPYTLLEIVQDGVGTIGFGYVLNPRQQITEQDGHTITLDLEPLTWELTQRVTRRGWTAQNLLSVVAARLGALVPGWAGMLPDPADDLQVLINLPSPTVLGGFLDTAKQFSQFVRLGINPDGSPRRVLEMGQFGAAPTVTLVSSNGGDADALAANGTVALVATVDYQPNDVSSLINVTVPFGGGAGDSIVTLERLWRIVNDPQYIDYGRYGTDADSLARTGKTSVFPEYNPLYPISDPLNPPTGAPQWYTTLPGTTVPVPLPAGHTVTVGARAADGTVPLTERDATGAVVVGAVPVLQQGAVGTRSFTLDGHDDYVMYDALSYALYGHHEPMAFTDAGLSYTDSSPANQEYTERALYLETMANFERFAHPHQTFTCTAPGIGHPTRAGDLIAVDYQRVSVGDDGAVVEMDVRENLRVMKVERTFGTASNGSEVPPVDTYTLSNLGRFDETDATGAANTAATLIAFQLRQDTSVAPVFIGPFAANVDALHPMVVPLAIPKQLFRWQKCSLRVDFQPYHATSTTAENVAGTPITFGVPHGDHTIAPQAGHAFGTTGIATSSDGFSLTNNGDTNSPIAFNVNTSNPLDFPNQTLKVILSAGKWILNAAGIGGAPVVFGKIALSTDQTATSHTVPIQSAVSVASSLTATLPVHTHPLDQRIPDGPTAPNCTVAINGQALTSGLVLTSGTRNADGTFAGSFEIDDISQLLWQSAGTTVTITLTPGTAAGNPYGVGCFQIGGTWFGEFGSLAAAGVIAQ